MEVTKWLKPSVSVSRIGDSASVQAVTRVNAEQALYGAFEVKHLFHGILHFLHSSRRPNLAAYCGLARPHLDSFEHDGLLDAVGTTIGGELAIGARINRATTLYSVGP